MVKIITYQDLLEHMGTERDLIDYIYTIISAYKRSDDYEQAVIANEYARRQNRTILNYQKLLYTVSGEVVPDNYSANYKLCSNFFYRLTVQENQYLLGNGVSWGKSDTSDKLGKDFDVRLQEAGRESLIGAVSYGFWDYDRMRVFNAREFAPVKDEETGALMAGVRFWQIDKTKPLRATFYEIDGYTEYIWGARDDAKGRVYRPKRPYVIKVRRSVADGEEIYDGRNYPSFPIVPLWGNPNRQSEFVGMRQDIDCYDLIKSGFANDIDDASLIYWTISNAGGMDDLDLAKFVDRMRKVKAAAVDDETRAESHTVEVPYASRETILDRLRRDIYEDFMAVDTKELSSGSDTATHIKAEYDPMDKKVDLYEYQVIQFIQGILSLAGIEDDPTFTRSRVVNASETLTMVLQAAEYLPKKYIVEKILALFGDIDRIDEVLDELDAEILEKMPIEVRNGSGTQGVGGQAGETPSETGA